MHDYAKQPGALRTELAKRSIDAFVAHDSIEPTEDWQTVIPVCPAELRRCLALLKPGLRESDWTDEEVGFCMARERLVIPVEFGLTPYGLLGKYQALRIKKERTEAGIALSVFELLVGKRESRDAMAGALVARWPSTGSWDGTRENYSFLTKLPPEVWTQQLVDEIWQARERNYNLQTANVTWKDSDQALHDLFRGLPFSWPSPLPSCAN
jgi:hypothetical protein